MLMNQVLTFGFTIGTLFDMKESEAIYENSKEEDKEKNYRNHFHKLNSTRSVFSPGPALGLYIALHKLLKGKFPKELITLRFGVSSRFDTIHPGTITLFNSLKFYLLKSEEEDMMPGYISLTSGMEQASSHKMQGADIVFTSSMDSAKEYYENGISSVNIKNISPEQNRLMYENRNGHINFIFDFDGVVADHSSEMIYQAAKRIEGLNPIDEFRKNEILNIEKPLPLGPLGNFIQKVSIIVDHYHQKMLKGEIKIKDIPLKSLILTARGGAAIFRVAKTLSDNNIKVSKADFADGREKHISLGMLSNKDVNLFLEDSIVHIEGAIKNNQYVLAGLVFNDYTSGKDTIEETVKALKLKNNIT